MQKMDKIIKKWWLRWSIYLLAGVLVKFLLDLTYSLLYRNYALLQPGEEYISAILLTVLTLETFYRIRQRLGQRISWEDNPRKRFIIQWFLGMAISIFFAFGLRWLVKLTLSDFSYVLLLDEVIILVFILVIITAMVFAEFGVFLLNNWRFSLAELERFKKENAESQFESLRSQVNPHFLFNSLNTLSSLIYENPEKAESFIRELSDVYRYVLENRGKELVTLKEELLVAQSYMSLVQLRFDENLTIRVDIPETCHIMNIAPLSIQLLIENAVKHNVISRKKPLYINIFVEDNMLVVKNNLQKKSSIEYSSQFGLKNIKSRYAFLSDAQMAILETADEFIVKIPLIHGK